MGFLSKLFGKTNHKLTKREFTEQLAQELQQAIPNTHVRIVDADNDEEISIHIDHDERETNIVYPDNLYASYVQERPDFAAYKQNIINNVYDVYYGEEESATLLPNIKHIQWVKDIEEVSNQAQTDPNTPPSRLVTFPFVGDLVRVIAMDYPSKLAYLFDSDLPEHTPDGSKDTALSMAMENLRTALDQVEITALGNSLHRIGLDQTYDASLVLLWEDIMPQLSFVGEPVLALIARDQFIVADGNVPEDIASLKHYAAEQVQASPHALSAQLYVYRNGRIGLYESLQ